MVKARLRAMVKARLRAMVKARRRAMVKARLRARLVVSGILARRFDSYLQRDLNK